MVGKSKERWEKLFSPGRLGTLELKNRIVMPPMVTEYAAAGGFVSNNIKNYYAERAKGGAGLVIVEATCVAPRGKGFARQLSIFDDEFIAGLSELAQAIKDNGARAAIQIHHAGMATHSRITGAPPLGPSPIPMRGYEPAEELSTEGLKEVENAFAQAALRARQAGFDGVEIHGAHLYLIAQFLSPGLNQRRDAYGGSVENRARLLVETVWAVREAVGATFPVWCRLNAAEYGLEAGGMTPADASIVARLAQEAGVDAISVSTFGWGRYATVNMPTSPGALLPLADAIKKVTRVPIIAVGRLDPKVAEVALKEGKGDFMAIGRALISDPHLPEKAAQGRFQDIVPCISCYECLRFGRERGGMRCSTNAAVGMEAEYSIRPAEKVKRVLVVGGGPAGMEAARVAALRGHQVTLVEKEARLGGMLRLAAKPRSDNRYPLLLNFLQTQLHKLGVTVATGREATPQLVAELKPDAVILATGGRPLIPPIPGVAQGQVVTAVAVMAGQVSVGPRVAVIGGERIGLRTAEYLAGQGKKVTVINRKPRFGEHFPPVVRRPLLDKLTEMGVTLLGSALPQEITAQGVIVETGGEQKMVAADSVVLATGATPEAGLLKEVVGLVPEVHLVGDGVEPRSIRTAIAEGYCAALSL